MTVVQHPWHARRWLRPLVVAVLAVGAGLASTDLADPLVRAVGLLLFFVLGPGVALVGVLRIPDPWRELALAIGVSLAVDVVVVAAIVYTGERGAADAFLVLTVLVSIAAAGVAAQLARAPGRRTDRTVTS